MEERATNTGHNIDLSRQLLEERGIEVDSVMLICRPYQQRRAYATCRQLWPAVRIVCASRPISLPDYVAKIGDSALVIHMLVGDTHRIMEYPKVGYAVEQEVPAAVHEAYYRLVEAGFTSRLQASSAPINLAVRILRRRTWVRRREYRPLVDAVAASTRREGSRGFRDDHEPEGEAEAKEGDAPCQDGRAPSPSHTQCHEAAKKSASDRRRGEPVEQRNPGGLIRLRRGCHV